MNNSAILKRAIRIKAVSDITSYSKPTIWRRAKTDPDFPKPFSIGPNATAWDEGEVIAWLEARKSQRPLNNIESESLEPKASAPIRKGAR
jgi:prophage regulatory protein